ncbi:MAG: restriction endonuclease [Lachnospiraceae bacterium]|nr:restriction endonuclease [Lachnospiraceae bacterium]
MNKNSRKNPGRYLLPVIPIAFLGVISYAKLTGDTAFEHKQECYAMAALFVASYTLIMLIIAICRAERLAGASMRKIDRMSGVEFEEWLQVMYKRHGYRARLTPASGDYGADLIVTAHDGTKTAIQAKRYRNAVGEAAVQQIIAAREYYGCDNAMVVTNSFYTRAATELASRTGVKLIHRKNLATKEMYP